MNNLEWIDKQILLVKENIQYHKDLLAESEEEYVDEIISTIKLLEPELQTLQQIKSKLEAWEDKEKPKKPERFISKFHVSPPKCPVCKTIPHTCTQKYCDECGQRLDWEVKDE